MHRLARRLGGKKHRPTSIAPSVASHWDVESRSYQTKESVVPSSSDVSSMPPDELAILIFHQMSPITSQYLHASWLGGTSTKQQDVLNALLELFNWRGQCILYALRTLACHVMLSGEEQQIDRVLAAFSKRWIKTNPSHGFKSLEVVHSISYALLILSSALQGSKDDHMSRREFADSTTNVLRDLDLKFPAKSAPGVRGIVRRPTISALVSDTAAYCQEDWFKFVREILKMFYDSLYDVPFETPPLDALENDAELSSSATNVPSSAQKSATDAEPSSVKDSESIATVSNLSQTLPYEFVAKEGPVYFRLFSSNRESVKKKHKEWVEAIGVVERGVLNLCSVPGRSVNDFANPAARKIILSLELSGSIAHVGSDAQWSLMLNDADSRLLHFRTGSEHTAEEFVKCCNYWAACLTKPPLNEMVSSTEYGWGAPFELLKSTPDAKVSSGGSEAVMVNKNLFNIYEWSPRKDAGLHSGLEPAKQLELLQSYVVNADAELTSHNSLLPEILRVYEGLPVFSRVMSNWEARSQFLLKKSVQFSGYCRALEAALEERN